MSIFFWFTVAAVSVAEAAIIIAALRMHVSSDPGRGILGARPMEVLWTVLPTILLGAVVFLSYNKFQAG